MAADGDAGQWRRQLIRGLWPLLAGFGIWSLGFGALYGLQALGCIWGWPDLAHRLALTAGWCVTLVALGALLFVQVGRSDGSFIHRAGIGASVAALCATVVVFAPVLFVSLCV